MRFAEVFLRLGCSLVAWMVVYAFFLWLAVVRVVGCGADGDEMFRLLLGMAPFAAGFSMLLRASRPLAEIHSILRWLGIPLMLVLPFTLWSAIGVLLRVNIGGGPLCNIDSDASWSVWWAPLQLAALAMVAWMVVRVWRSVAEDRRTRRPG